MTALQAIAFIWTWHFFWMTLLTYAIGRAAYHHSGWPVHSIATCRLLGNCRYRWIVWPVAGRWLLFALLLTITAMIGDLTRTVWQIVFDLRGGDGTVGWDSVIFRALPLPIEPWVFWRQWRRGLTNDYATTRVARRKVRQHRKGAASEKS